MKKNLMFLVFIFVFMFVGCVSVDSSDVVEDNGPSEVLRLTTEKVMNKDGVTYILVAFPKETEGHQFVYDVDTNEWVGIAVLKKAN